MSCIRGELTTLVFYFTASVWVWVHLHWIITVSWGFFFSLFLSLSLSPSLSLSLSFIHIVDVNFSPFLFLFLFFVLIFDPYKYHKYMCNESCLFIWASWLGVCPFEQAGQPARLSCMAKTLMLDIRRKFFKKCLSNLPCL